MYKEIVNFVTFYSPGIIVAETSKIKTTSLDPYEIEWPDYAYAFQLSTRQDIIEEGKRYTGEERKVGPTYYHPNSKVETLEEVRHNSNATPTLVSNMEINKWKKIVWSRWGNWPQPFDDTDEILTKRGDRNV